MIFVKQNPCLFASKNKPCPSRSLILLQTITLVQRPPRYELFLKELQKNISQPSPHIQTALKTALKKIQKGTANMNEKVRYTVLFNPQDLKKIHGKLSEGSSDKSESQSSAELSIGDRDYYCIRFYCIPLFYAFLLGSSN
ncbi:RhoGEF domain-containing protein [Candidatus Protochlamydia naegleriophila]|uniref:RhoGEF domain-containing protein n=1 Tax=Candidatus Protochlamydia naegleriophila TaxID=389348 RepID=A0A0U5JAD8_9BACT|nr:RhoGEF domain-containing protein [Candidatus Protochlamydia naegleriophila]CUI16087.1 RhoGEF domain-containing protein [Candidatus Protochlamydia naegleriophila]